jgi:hypothetical protein
MMNAGRLQPMRWQEIDRLYHAALEREASQRAAFLAASCPDESLRREVESLLDYDARAENFIEAGALEVASQLEPEEGGLSYAG